MSYQDGWAALNMEMPERVPRTEFSLEMHYGMIREVTGQIIKPEDDPETRLRAGAALFKALNYDFVWSTLTGGQIFGDNRTDMGHAVYQEGGTDYRPNMFQLYSDPEEALKIDDIATCGVNVFVMEPMTDMAYIADKYGKTHGFVGNADTRILLHGSKEDIYNKVKRCMDIGKSYPGFFMAVGNHIPPNTPLENVLFYNDVYEKMSKR